MLLNKGWHGGERVLSRLSIELMTRDHITDAQKAASPFFPGFWRIAAGASASPSSPAATIWREFRAASAGMAATAPPGLRTRRRRWSPS